MIPIRLEIENFMSYEKASVDFSKFSSALIMGDFEGDSDVSNATGKTTLLEAIGWALFNKSRKKQADSVVKRGKTVCKVVLELQHDNKLYKIIRTRNAKFNSQNSIELWELTPNGDIQIKGDTNTEIDEKIRELIKSNYEIFINSSYFKQNSISDFLNGTSSQRQKLASSILNLDRWNSYSDKAKSEFQNLEKQINILKYQTKELEDVEERFSLTQSEIEKILNKENFLRKEENILTEEINILENKLSNLKGESQSLKSYYDFKSKLNYIKDKIIENKDTKTEKLKVINHSKEEVEKNNKAIEEIKAVIDSISPTLELKKHIDLFEDEKKLVRGLTKVDALERQIDNLEKNDECFACGTELSKINNKHQRILSKKAELNELKLKVDKFKEKLEEEKSIQEKIKQKEIEINKLSNKISSLISSSDIHNIRLEVAQSEVFLIEKNLKELYNQQEEYEQYLSKIDNLDSKTEVEEITNDLNLKTSKKKKVLEEMADIRYNYGILTEKLNTIEKDKNKRTEIKIKLDALNKDATIYSTLMRSFGRSGIQAIIVDNIMEELARSTNEYLNMFSNIPTYVNFITQKKDTKGSWKETLDIEVRTQYGISDFEDLSGGEGFRVAFAIRLALSTIQARRMGGESQILMLDEVSTSLDKQGLSTFISIIKKLEKNLKVLVITHDDNLKEEFDYVIKVRKTGDTSEIVEA